MTARLEKAIQQLSPEKLQELEDYAEALVQRDRPAASVGSYGLAWVGKGAHLYPEHKTGVDASHAAGKLIVESLERSLPK
jgi:hypothetical protein